MELVGDYGRRVVRARAWSVAKPRPAGEARPQELVAGSQVPNEDDGSAERTVPFETCQREERRVWRRPRRVRLNLTPACLRQDAALRQDNRCVRLQAPD